MFNLFKKPEETVIVTALKDEIQMLRNQLQQVTAIQLNQANYMFNINNSLSMHINSCNQNFTHLQQELLKANIDEDDPSDILVN